MDAYILFEVGGATYAVQAGQVQQVEMLELLTRVPKAPEFVEGVTAIRGQVVPVVSMRRRFQLEEAEKTLRTRLIVIRLGERRIGMLVDSAREFVRFTSEQILPPPEGLSGPGMDYLEGAVYLPGRLVLVINLQRLFDPTEKAAVASVDASTDASAAVAASAAAAAVTGDIPARERPAQAEG